MSRWFIMLSLASRLVPNGKLLPGQIFGIKMTLLHLFRIFQYSVHHASHVYHYKKDIKLASKKMWFIRALGLHLKEQRSITRWQRCQQRKGRAWAHGEIWRWQNILSRYGQTLCASLLKRSKVLSSEKYVLNHGFCSK